MEDSIMKYALIGCGRISPNHIAAAKANNLEFVGMCDIVESNMEEKAIKFDSKDRLLLKLLW